MLTRSPYFRQIMHASPLCMHEDLSERGLFFTVLALCDTVQGAIFQWVTILFVQTRMKFFTVLALLCCAS